MFRSKNIVFIGAFIALVFTSYSCSNNPTKKNKALQAVNFEYLNLRGELAARIHKNMDRLEESKYQPQHVFLSEEESGSWPGDTEGRTILGLVLNAQAIHRQPEYLEQIIALIPENLNEKGYMGPVYENKMSEQQLSGNGWLLRGLCEYYEWNKDEKVLPIISSIANNLFVMGKGFYSNYPIDPALRITDVGTESGTIQNEENSWMLSSDIGCVFIGMDGLIHAYKHLKTAEIKSVIDEMIEVFLKMDLVAIKAQTHASLTACRGLIRYAEITGDKKYIDEAEKRWKIYKSKGMTENYENYNWFNRYNTWTEPCAIVDSYLLAVQLWQHTSNPSYRNDAEFIYYNGICHTQRYNGGFGCDNCPGDAMHDVCLRVSAEEAHWCCTMRGAEGVSKAAQYSYFINNDTIIIPFYNESSIVIPTGKNKKISLEQTTSYPFENNVTIGITESDNKKRSLKFAVPPHISTYKLIFNKEEINSEIKNGFISLTKNFKTGDFIELQFEQKIIISNTINSANTDENQVHVYYGPLMLGLENGEPVKLSENDKVVPMENMIFMVENKDIKLTPVYHLMNPKVWDKKTYWKQILF